MIGSGKIDSVKEYDAPKFLRQEKRAERTDFAKKTNIRLPARAGSESENAQEWQTRKVKILQMKSCEILS